MENLPVLIVLNQDHVTQLLYMSPDYARLSVNIDFLSHLLVCCAHLGDACF